VPADFVVVLDELFPRDVVHAVASIATTATPTVHRRTCTDNGKRAIDSPRVS
jgi:hypothetical protein